jgi:hypothetical protein
MKIIRGGIVIRVGDEILDASVTTQLKRIEKRIDKVVFWKLKFRINFPFWYKKLQKKIAPD